MYDLTSVLDIDALEAVQPGSSILISGPAMTGKEDLAYDMLADGIEAGEGAIALSTGDRADNVIDKLESRVHSDTFNLGVIDCAGEQGSEHQGRENVYIHHVASPGDLTGIGIGITEALESLHERGSVKGRLSLSSLSTMLTYTDQKTVFKLCHVLASRLDAANYLGLFTIDASAHEEQTLQVIKQAFDGMIEIRENGNGVREARVRGLQPTASDWTEF